MTDFGASTGSIPLTPARVQGAMPWVIWIVGSLTYLLAIIGRSSLAGLGTDVAVRFDADSSTLALFATLQLAVYGGMQIPAGLLLDRFGSRVVLTTGMLVMAAGSLWLAFAPDAASAILARILTGAGDAMVFPSVLRLLTLWFPVRRVPLLQQVTAQVGQLGQILSVAVLAAAVHSVSWAGGFCALGAVFVVFAVIDVLSVRERRILPARPGAARRTGQLALLRAALAEPGTRLAFWVHFVTPFAGTAFALLWGVPFLVHGEGFSSADASLMVTVFVLAGAVFAPLMGTLSGSYPRRRALVATVSVIAQAVVLAGILLTPGPAPFWLIIVWMVVLSSGGAASMIAFDVTRRFNPVARLSTATGIVNMGGFIAALIAVYLIGLVLDLQGADPASYTLDELRLAWASVFVLWAVGLSGIALESWRVRRAQAR
ncbi:nitrate/nitrite transporter [Microbacterium sp. SORGH_AS_0888]|uniref:MFS transporter n=1 Tax=Microbacterium sp. SORGH_AS_0888 TaxID=3041791 RepID=UPI002785BD64|nr:MFS transporter [Microbacterium sp. SORGH_AS_0888]MDQ1130526.1 MFS family permease [Microbacterium sp. SORGH_AS_0888]